MSDAGPPRWLHGVAVAQTSATVYAALGATFGAALYLIAPYFHGNPWGWFFAGTAIPQGPLYFFYTSDWVFERRLIRLKRWRDENLMTSRMYDESLKRAVAWRDERLYGKAVISSRISPRTRLAEPSSTSSPGPPEIVPTSPESDPNPM